MSETPAGGLPRPFRFDMTISVGNVLTLVGVVVAAGVAWSSAVAQIATVDTRTADYRVVRDAVLAEGVRLDALTSAIAAQTASNDAVMRSLNAVREDLAAIRATLAARL